MVTINLEADVVRALWIVTLFTQILPSNLRPDTILELAREITLKKSVTSARGFPSFNQGLNLY